MEIRLHLNGGIFLQPLIDEQIQDYLAGLNQVELWGKLQLDTELLKLVRTPLFLSILGFISFTKTLSLQEWRTLTSTKARLEYLIDAYHFSLRLILYRNGSIPWNYARFLDYCTKRLFLQRVGGRYRFIHRLLQEHFAAIPLEK